MNLRGEVESEGGRDRVEECSVVGDKEAIIGRISGQEVGRERQISEPRERRWGKTN